MQRVSTRPRKISNSEPWRVSKLCALRWPSSEQAAGQRRLAGRGGSGPRRGSARRPGRTGDGRARRRAAARRRSRSTACSISCGSTNCRPSASARNPYVAGDQRQRDGIEAQYLRPFLGDDVEQCIEAVGLDRGEHGGMDRGDRARMAAREGEEVLIGLFRRAEPLAQLRDRRSSKGMTCPMRRKITPRDG